MTNATNGESWIEYRRLVLKELEDLHVKVAAVNRRVDGVRDENVLQDRELLLLKFKVGIIGAAAGSFFGALVSWIAGRILGP